MMMMMKCYGEGETSWLEDVRKKGKDSAKRYMNELFSLNRAY